MKKAVLLAVSACLVFGVAACSSQGDKKASYVPVSPASTASTAKVKETKDVREKVWNQFSEERKAGLVGWQSAKVSTTILPNGSVGVDPSYGGKEVYVVDFSKKEAAEPDNTVAYVDKETMKVVGFVLSM
ncbi:hypothetical protein [Ectobacillus ponti]|uniref:Lipoprotein n=1 Tax=Ectobacillus ponti TaxID=2961894 RepID=A0AA41X3V7_9BACI|nr:hypothetical protein [Ectobacillus ponti]MCP8968451.1 hypothetical protein [Ectobacillus ponti]